MIRSLQKIGNSKGIVIPKAILEMLELDESGSFEVQIQDGGLFLKPINVKQIYKRLAKKHRKSLDKLGQ